MELKKFMEIFNINKMWEGQALWQILANRYAFYNEEEIENGSFRYNGSRIAESCGGDYMDYYCNDLSKKKVDKLWKRMADYVTLETEDDMIYWSP